MFLDVISLNVFLEITDELNVFCGSFEFFIVDLLFFLASFCSYLILILKKNQFDSKIYCF